MAKQEPKAYFFDDLAICLQVDGGSEPAAELCRHAGFDYHDRFLISQWLKPRKR